MSFNLSQLLEQHGLEFKDLNSQERETLEKWSKAWQRQEITPEKIAEMLAMLIEGVQKELADVKESTSFFSWLFNRKKDIFLKARLKNYLMLRDFVTGPEKARKFIEENLKNINSKKQ
jgi:hypothetical protein